MKIQSWAAAMLTTCLLGAPVAFAESGAGGEARAAHNAGTEETGPEVDWTRGPAQVDIGNDIAQIELPEGLVGRPQSPAGVAVEVFVEEHQLAPVPSSR
ncbi:hypothetical protein CYFUS_001039 [Cystobacter fuscus]|uniref:Uncharacterized protein n=1 Tax=Cystobacter fuscus TaxID=43 RepID=A0A250IV46_9BACT|nr:hypothetical protein [Cystobacter fuscus]ATB35625.1 hypothetical protein CYFUS_001039 [Cystobacter fuscus]